MYVYIYICICMVITCSRVWINPVRLLTLLVVSQTGKMNISLSPFAPKNLVSRDRFGRSVPRQLLLILHTQAESGAYLTGFLPITAAVSIYLYRRPPSGHSRVYRVTQLRTDGVHCRESAGTGPAVLKVVPATGATFAEVSPWTN